MDKYNLDRFIKAQQENYEIALNEIKDGKKISHWSWYIFPQLKGLGNSEKSIYYSIKNLEEAKDYLDNRYLYNNLINICNELLKLDKANIVEVMGDIDSLKLCSSMTLFSVAKPEVNIFKDILKKFYNGKMDEKTIKLIK